jgi:hypothetical protein
MRRWTPSARAGRPDRRTRYDVLAHLDMADGRLGLTELATAILLSLPGELPFLAGDRVSDGVRGPRAPPTG